MPRAESVLHLNRTSMKSWIPTFLAPFLHTPKIECYFKHSVVSLAVGRADHGVFDIPHVGSIIKSLRTTTSLLSKACSVRYLEYLVSVRSIYMTA